MQFPQCQFPLLCGGVLLVWHSFIQGLLWTQWLAASTLATLLVLMFLDCSEFLTSDSQVAILWSLRLHVASNYVCLPCSLRSHLGALRWPSLYTGCLYAAQLLLQPTRLNMLLGPLGCGGLHVLYCAENPHLACALLVVGDWYFWRCQGDASLRRFGAILESDFPTQLYQQ